MDLKLQPKLLLPVCIHWGATFWCIPQWHIWAKGVLPIRAGSAKSILPFQRLTPIYTFNIFMSAHLHIYTSIIWIIFTSRHIIFTSAHLLIFISSHLHILILTYPPSLPLFFISSHPHIFTSSLLRPRAVPTRQHQKATLFARNEAQVSKTNVFSENLGGPV